MHVHEPESGEKKPTKIFLPKLQLIQPAQMVNGQTNTSIFWAKGSKENQMLVGPAFRIRILFCSMEANDVPQFTIQSTQNGQRKLFQLNFV